jgi:S-adenosylmethionine decarboxylase
MILKDGHTTDDQYGVELVMDLYHCDLAKISDGEHIRKYLIELCDNVIFMKRFGEPIVEHFGHENPITAGYSMVQLIETSCVSGHFSEHKKSCYINVFSCKWFDVEAAAEFTKNWFGASEINRKIADRI